MSRAWDYFRYIIHWRIRCAAVVVLWLVSLHASIATCMAVDEYLEQWCCCGWWLWIAGMHFIALLAYALWEVDSDE